MEERGEMENRDSNKKESLQRIFHVEDNRNGNKLLPDEVSHSEEDQDITIDRREDVNSLLNFMNLASDNIKASLDRSTSCKRAVDHKKYLQKQLQHFTSSSQPPSSFGGPMYPPPGTASVRQQSCVKNKLELNHCISTKAVHPVNKSTSEEENLYHNKDSDNSFKEEYNKHTNNISSDICSAHSSIIYSSMATAVEAQVPDSNIISAENDEDTDSNQHEKTVKVTADLVLMDSLFKQSDGGTGDKIMDNKASDKKSVPLRQRSLPASFWKEPNNRPSTGEYRYTNGLSLMQYHPQFPAHMLEHNSMYRLPQNVPYHAVSNVHPAFSELSFKTSLTNLEYPKMPLPGSYDEKIASHLGLCNDIPSRNYPYTLPRSARLLSARDFTNGPAYLAHLHRQSVPMSSGLENSFHLGRIRGQSCVDCCIPRHRPITLTSGVVQPPACCRIAPVLSQRPSLWKPIPTKSISSFPFRYHPFAGVQ